MVLREDRWLVQNPDVPTRRYFEWLFEVWHYTGWAGLEGIVTGNVIWATESGGLNDPSEAIRANDSLLHMWEHLLPNLANGAPGDDVGRWLRQRTAEVAAQRFFFVSACTDGDKLAHWKSYAGGSGYAIELERKTEYRLLEPSGGPHLFYPPFAPEPWWHPVSYGGYDDTVAQHGRFLDDWIGQYPWNGDRQEKRFLERALDCFAAVRDGRIRDVATALLALEADHVSHLCFNKHEGYAEEDEVRLAFIEPPFPGYIHERPGGYTTSGSIAYMKIASDLSDCYAYSIANPGPLPIKRVRIGPRYNTEVADEVQRVTALLHDNGYSGVPVEVSSIPYRG